MCVCACFALLSYSVLRYLCVDAGSSCVVFAFRFGLQRVVCLFFVVLTVALVLRSVRFRCLRGQRKLSKTKVVNNIKAARRDYCCSANLAGGLVRSSAASVP